MLYQTTDCVNSRSQHLYETNPGSPKIPEDPRKAEYSVHLRAYPKWTYSVLSDEPRDSLFEICVLYAQALCNPNISFTYSVQFSTLFLSSRVSTSCSWALVCVKIRLGGNPGSNFKMVWREHSWILCFFVRT